MVSNYFSPNGISLIRTNKEISWASDSLFSSSKTDSLIETEPVNSGIDSTESKVEQEKVVEDKLPEKESLEKNRIEKKEEIKEPEVIPFDEPKNVTLEQAYSLFKDGVTFLDARDESDYLAGYISRAINIPYYDFENNKHKLDKLSKDKPLVIYCAGTDCDLSILLANQLSKEGFKQIYIFFGGWLEWVNANYPTENPAEE